MLYDHSEVLTFLPHRDPFLFVDSIESIGPGMKVVGQFVARKDLSIFEGHFPGNPVFPGVCQVEMMAQVASFLFYRSTENQVQKIKNVALLGVDFARFRRPIYPGQSLRIKAELKRSRGVFKTFYCEVFHETQQTSEAQILASLDVENSASGEAHV